MLVFYENEAMAPTGIKGMLLITGFRIQVQERS
jgi:hypothetical protein